MGAGVSCVVGALVGAAVGDDVVGILVGVVVGDAVGVGVLATLSYMVTAFFFSSKAPGYELGDPVLSQAKHSGPGSGS